MSAPKFTAGQRVKTPDGTGTIIDTMPSVSRPGHYIYCVQSPPVAYLEEELAAAPPVKSTGEKTA